MNRKIKVAFFAVLAVLLEFSNAANYCDISSCGNQQTLCRYPNSGPSSRCTRFQGSGLSDTQRRNILNLHNKLRRNVAIGNETRGSPGPQPAARYMPNLQWDTEIAVVAQRWADQCSWGHDSCRNVARFSVGQNIAYKGTTGSVNSTDVLGMVQSWYDEVKFFSRYQVASYSGKGANGQQVGHYTQLVWAKTTHLGCGTTRYFDGQYNRLYLVCNYGPAGNYPGQPLYQADVS